MPRRLSDLLTGATVATYLLVALGATLATREATGACGAWPGCLDAWGGLDAAVALGHRIAAVLAFALVVLAALRARRGGAPRGVQRLLGVAVVAFPVQIGLGGGLALGVGGALGQLHLLVAVGIFATLLGALVLALEAETGTADADRDDSRPPAPGGRSTAGENHPDGERHPGGEHNPDPPGDRRPTTGETGVDPAPGGLRRTARAYLALTKPRLLWLLCLLALAGIALASLEGHAVDGVTVVATLAGGVLAVGASGAINHVVERERDARMERTADRPLATGAVSVRGAVAFALGLAGASVAVLWTLTTPVATLLTLAAIGYYGVLYTVVLKPRTRWNTVLGGGAGALPAVIGWAAVAGSVGLPAVLLAAVVFLWTPAHFYNLALAYRADYAAGGYPMVPVVLGPRSTRRRIVAYLGATLLATSALGASTPLGYGFALVAVAAAGAFLAAVVGQYRARTDAAALRTFHASNAYLGAVLAAVVLSAVLP